MTLLLVWLIGVAGTQLRCVDAAREAARAAARADSPDAVTALARQVAPEGAMVAVRTGGGVVRVSVSATAMGSGLLAGLPGITVSGTAVAAAERTGVTAGAGP